MYFRSITIVYINFIEKLLEVASLFRLGHAENLPQPSCYFFGEHNVERFHRLTLRLALLDQFPELALFPCGIDLVDMAFDGPGIVRIAEPDGFVSSF